MIRPATIALTILCCVSALPALAQQNPPPRPAGEGPGQPQGTAFTLSSSELVDGEALPLDLKCTRSGGDGASPPLSWDGAPPGTAAYAIVLQHYPKDTYPGVNEPSHYWLVWNIPGNADGVARGNPDSLGIEGSDKDIHGIGYTPPCSPAGAGTHEYTIWVYALDGPLQDLPQQDDIKISWPDVMDALEGHVLAADSLTFVD